MQQKFASVSFQLKSLEDDGTFEGYASVFNNEDSDGDIILPGAFNKKLQEFRRQKKRPKMLWQHNPSIIVGTWLELSEDQDGLAVQGRPIIDLDKGREAYVLMKAGELDALSIGGNIKKSKRNPNHSYGQIISELDLWEISLVTWGANGEARIDRVKSLERILRDAGYSRKEALQIVSGGYKAAFDQQSDSDDHYDDEEAAAVKAALINLHNTVKGDRNG